MIEVRYQRGLHLPEADLWLDPGNAKSCAFVSHAHADHFARHQTVLCSEVTGTLLRHRYHLADHRIERLAFHVPLVRNGFRLRLIPAGHIPGSAMLHVTRISDNATLLYTGDFKTRRSRTAENVNFLAADTLILETTFGAPGYVFPSAMEVEAEVLRFVNDCFADGETPVLLGYSLGKTQEALALLEEHGIPVLLHPSAAEMTRACIEAGVPGLSEPAEFDGHAPPGHVVIAPPHAVRTALFRGLKAKRTAMLSGWALQPGAKYRYRVDAMIPFSDHADHPGLLECIQRVRPRRILTVHGFAREFAAELRARGMDAWSAEGGDQLELPIQKPAKVRTAPRGPWHKRPVCPLADFSDLCRLVEETGSRVAKAGFLSAYLGGLDSEADLRIAARWLAGGLTPVLKPSSLTLRQALASMPGARDERLREIQQSHKDPLKVVRVFLQELQLQPEILDLPGTEGFLGDFRDVSQSIDGIRLLNARLAALNPAEGETLVRLLTGDLRIGLDPGLVEDALASAFKTTPEEIRTMARQSHDIGEAAVVAKNTAAANKAPQLRNA